MPTRPSLWVLPMFAIPMTTLKKIGRTASTGVNIGHQLGLFSTGPVQTAAANQPSDLEMQSFLSVLKRIAQGVGKLRVLQNNAVEIIERSLVLIGPQIRWP